MLCWLSLAQLSPLLFFSLLEPSCVKQSGMNEGNFVQKLKQKKEILKKILVAKIYRRTMKKFLVEKIHNPQ